MVKSDKSRRWCFTLNNCTPEEETLFKNIPCKCTVCGPETGVEGTPHLEGFVMFNAPKTTAALKTIHGTCHLPVAKKSSESTSNCCKKGEQTKAEWDEHHNDGPNFGLNCAGCEAGDFPDQQGKRTDLDAVKEAIEGGTTDPRSLCKHHSNAFSRHRRLATEHAIDHKPNVELDTHPLRPWQQQAADILDGPMDQRKMAFAVDTEGNAGKSWFAECCRQLHPHDAMVCAPGKKADMVHAASVHGFDPRVLILDVPRSKQTRKVVGDLKESALMHDFLEEMKNRFVFVTKCESHPWGFARPHVLATANSSPDLEAMSHDRHQIIKVASPTKPHMFQPEPTSAAIPGQTFPKLSKSVEEWICPPGHNDFTAQQKLEWHHFSGAPAIDSQKKGPRHNTLPLEDTDDNPASSHSDKRETGSRGGAAVIPPPPTEQTEQTDMQDSSAVATQPHKASSQHHW